MPSCAHPINNALVRREWGWDGFFISDCNAIEHFCAHNYSLGRAPGTNAWAALVQGGIDYNCGSFYQDQLLKQVQAGAINQTDVDTAVRRVLKTMFRLGQHPPFCAPRLPMLMLSFCGFRDVRSGGRQHLR